MSFSKLGKIDYRIIYAAMTILVALPLIYPINVPQAIGDNTKNYARKIQSLKDGDVVVATFSGYATMLPDIEPIYIATWKMLLQKNVKLIVLMTHPDSPIVIRQEFAQVGYDKKVEGVDFVIMPYWSLDEAAYMIFAEDMRKLYTKDIRGIAIDQIPMMKDIKNARDIDLLICGSPEMMVRRFTQVYGTPLVNWGTATDLLPFVPPFYNPEKGPVFGYCGGASQGAELESFLVASTGQAFYGGAGLKTNDAKNLGVIGCLVIVILGNLSMLGGKEEEK